MIKDACEKCGSAEGPMVVQHSIHPDSLNDILHRLAEAAGVLLHDWIAKEKVLMADRYDEIKLEPIPTCPKCGSTAIRWHKTSQQWKCKSTTGLSWNDRLRGACCGNTFPIPIEAEGLTPAAKKVQASLNREAYDRAKNSYWNFVCEQFGKEAVLESLRQSEIYSSLVDTRTLCKRCAYIEDKESGRISAPV